VLAVGRRPPALPPAVQRPLDRQVPAGRADPPDSRIGAKTTEAQERLLSPDNLQTVAALTRFAEARGRTILELAFGWLLTHAAVPSIIAGVSSPAQAASNAAAAGWDLTAAEMDEVDEILRMRGAAAKA
jgi:aryl-alcohol dehydrogenase-like predicted oxidoreductase